MSFAPILPLSGTAGWALLKRTMAAQSATLNATPEMARDANYFSANIGKITSADQLVNDRRLLKVALGAFGLEGDVANKAFIKRVLTDGTQSKTALANKLADKRYAQLSAAFGFDQKTPATQGANFATKVLAAYKARSFETAAVFGGMSGASVFLMRHLAAWYQAEGLDPATARRLVAETLRGNAEVLLQSDEPLDAICKGVTTPGGITEQLLSDLGQDGALDAWHRAMTRVLHRMAPARKG
jgi:hypothetical protein